MKNRTLNAIFITGLGVYGLVSPSPALAYTDPRDLYRDTIHSLAWIVTMVDGSESHGSGVVIDQERELVVTNSHVVQGQLSVDVYFPRRDSSGRLITDRDYYRNNRASLRKLGYYGRGRVIAEDSEADLALLELHRLPEAAREINHDFDDHAFESLQHGDAVHIFGNPAGRPLWRWNLGQFNQHERVTFRFTSGQRVEYKAIHTYAYTYGGTSGGAVVNDEGELLGIHSSGDRGEADVSGHQVPTAYVKELLDTVEQRWVVSLSNRTNRDLAYQIKWWPEGDWHRWKVRANVAKNHYSTSKAEGYPKVKFNYCWNNGKSKETIIELDCYTRNLGKNGTITRRLDAREYHFALIESGTRLVLLDSENE